MGLGTRPSAHGAGTAASGWVTAIFRRSRSGLSARGSTGLFLAMVVVVVAAALLLPHTSRPAQAQTPTVETRIWSATLTVGTSGTVAGYGETQLGLAQVGSLGTDSFAASLFEIGGSGYRVGSLVQIGAEHLRLIVRSNVPGSSQQLQLPAHDYILRVGDFDFSFHGTNGYTASVNAYQFALSGLSLTNGQTLRVSLWGLGLPSVFGLPYIYDLDEDGLIEVSNLQQLDAIRYDLNGNGLIDSGQDAAATQAFNAAFPDAAPSMGCPSTGCRGYELTADLDFDTNGNGSIGAGDTYWNSGYGWHPIGNRGSNWGSRIAWYSAIFDGNGHTISNMYIRRTFAHYLGLFGHVSGHIRNLGMEDAYIDGGTRVGIIAGSVGNNHSQLNQHSGTAALGSVSVSYATGRIVGNGSRVGSLVGELSGYVVATWADVRIETPPYTRPYPYFGGIAGCVYSNGAANGTVKASYILGSVIETIPYSRSQSWHPVAHLCSGGSNNYEPGVNADSYFDGNRYQVSNQWAKSTESLARPTGYTGIYANWNVNVRGDAAVDDPWDFGTNRDYPKLKADKNGDGVYTVEEFTGQDQVPGGSTDYDLDNDNLIEIANMLQLNAVRFDVDGDGDVLWSSAPQYPEAFTDAVVGMGCPDVCRGYELANDIDHDANGNGRLDGGDWPYDEGAGFRPIGHEDDAAYTAEFNGNGYVIRNLNIHRAGKRVGLFGAIGGSAYIHHVGLNDVAITSTDEAIGDVGALVGFAQGAQTRISANYATGTVTGVKQVGGLVGSNQGVVRANWTQVTVSGNEHVGGLVGHNGGEVRASYARGSASGTSLVHGAVGVTDGGSLSQVYFDRNRHQTVTDQVHPRYRSALQKQTRYAGLYSGWNVDLDGDGSADDPWDFGAAISYPVLKADRDGDGTAAWQEFGDQQRVASADSSLMIWADRMTAGSARFYGEAGFLQGGTGGPTDREENPAGYGSLIVGSFAIDTTEYVVTKLAATPVPSSGQATLHFSTDAALPGQGAGYSLYLTDAMGEQSGGQLIHNSSEPGNTYSVYGVSVVQAGQTYMVRMQSTPSIGLSEKDYRGGENFGSVIASVKLSGGSDAEARSVSYRLAQNQHRCNLTPGSVLATPGEDFVVPSGTVTFQSTSGPRVLTIEIPVQLINDDIDEADEEVFCLEAYNPQNAQLGRAFALMRIMDDDVAKLSIEPISRNIAPRQPALFRLNLESELASPPGRTVNVNVSAANISGIATGVRTIELTNLQSVDGVASFDFSVPTGNLQPDSTGQITVELQASPHPLQSNSDFSYRLHDSLPTSATVQMKVSVNPNVWTTVMTAGTANDGLDIGYLVPGFYSAPTFGHEGYGSLADGNEFTIDGVAYAAIWIDQQNNAPTLTFRTDLALPLHGLNYSLHLTNHATSVRSGGRLIHDPSVNVGGNLYLVPGVHDLQVGQTYTVELTRLVDPEISIEPVHDTVPASGSAQFRIVADTHKTKRLRVGFDVYEKKYSSPYSFSTIWSTNSVDIPNGQTEAIFSYPIRGTHDRVIEVHLKDGPGYLKSAVRDTSAIVRVVAGAEPPGQVSRVNSNDDATILITYHPRNHANAVSLNKLVPSGTFDRSYMRMSDGKYVPYEWEWEQTSGPQMELDGGDLFTLPNLPHGTRMSFRVTATNAAGVTKTHDLLLEVVNPGNTAPLQAPVANAGADVWTRAGTEIMLDGSGSRSPTGDWRDLDLRWQLLRAPTRHQSLSYQDEDPSFLAQFTMPELYLGEYLEFRLTATLWGVSRSDTVRVIDSHALTTANAGPDQESAPGQRVTLAGSGSMDETVQRASGVSYSWTQRPRSTVALRNADTARPWFILPSDASPGQSLQFELVVTDRQGRQASDMVTVSARASSQPAQPTACAGPDQSGAPGETVTLAGRCSVNPFGKWYRMDHAWTQTAGDPVTLSSLTRGDPSFAIPARAAQGDQFEFELTVTAENGQSDRDRVVVTVRSAPEASPPAACAGPDLEAEPGDSVTLEGDCSTNPHGVWWRMAHGWTQPPGQLMILSDPSRGRPMFVIPTSAAPGTVYTFTLTVTDNDGESDSDQVTVTVTGQAANVDGNYVPVFDEGASATRKLDERSPADTDVGDPLSASDADGDSLTYALSGTDAGAFAIDEDSGQIKTIAGQGYVYSEKPLYRVSVTADDGRGGVARIDVVVNIQDKNDPPRFIEGDSTTRSLPENSPAGTRVGELFLATDPEVNPLTYGISGTDAGSFTMDQYTGYLKTKSGVVYDFETKPTYELTVTATDPGGLSDSIDVTVTLVDVAEANAEPQPDAEPNVNAVSACVTELGALTEATVYAGSGDDATCRSHHQDNPARYFRFTLAEQSTVVVDLSAGALFVSTGTPNNGWGTVPGAGYAHRVSVRKDNGKLVHDGSNSPTLSLAAGDYTIEVAGSGAFTISISPQ